MQAPDECPSERRHRVGIVAEGAVTNHVMAVRIPDIKYRRAIDVDTEVEQLGRNQAGIEPGQVFRPVRVPVVQRPEPGRHRRSAPVRRPQALHPATFLVDQHRCFTSDRRAQILNQPIQLRWLMAVAAKQDKSERIGLAQEIVLAAVEAVSGASENTGLHRTTDPDATVAPPGMIDRPRSVARRCVGPTPGQSTRPESGTASPSRPA